MLDEPKTFLPNVPSHMPFSEQILDISCLFTLKFKFASKFYSTFEKKILIDHFKILVFEVGSSAMQMM